MSKCISIARYNKDMSWIHQLPLDINIVVYNKGSPIEFNRSHVTVRNVENIGLDQASHLQFIVDNYDCLPDVVLFAQDDLDKHTTEKINIYKNMYTNKDLMFYIDKMFSEALKYGHSMNAFPFNCFGVFSPSYDFKLPCCYNDHVMTNLTFGEWFEQNIKTPYPTHFFWFKNSIFAVQKRFILKRPKDYYQNLLSQFLGRKNEIDHFMERSWFYALMLDEAYIDNLILISQSS